jgi:hypothetical protein
VNIISTLYIYIYIYIYIVFKWQICYSSQNILKIPPWTSLHAASCMCEDHTFSELIFTLFCACSSIQNAHNSSHVSTLCQLCSSFVINQNLMDLRLGYSSSLSQKPFRNSPCSDEHFFLQWPVLSPPNILTVPRESLYILLAEQQSLWSCWLWWEVSPVFAFSERKRNILKWELFWAGILYPQTWNNRVTSAWQDLCCHVGS